MTPVDIVIPKCDVLNYVIQGGGRGGGREGEGGGGGEEGEGEEGRGGGGGGEEDEEGGGSLNLLSNAHMPATNPARSTSSIYHQLSLTLPPCVCRLRC